MLTRRAVLITVLGVVASSLPLAVPPAVAVGHTTIVSRTGLPNGVTAGASPCEVSGTPKDTITHVKGPGTPPLGVGSLEVKPNASAADGVLVAMTQNQLHHLTTLKVNTDYLGSGGEFLAGVQFTDGSDLDLLYTAPGSGWHSTNLLTATLVWQDFNTSEVLGHGTLAEYEAARPDATVVNWGAFDFDCEINAASDFAVDDFQVATGGGTTIYDFEPPLTAKLSGHASDSSVRAGTKVTITGTLKGSGKPLKNEKLALYRKPAGTTKFKKIGSATTDKHGVATGKAQRVLVTSRYQWRFAGDDTHDIATSKPILVRVSAH
jgi:hypothetical protein